MSFDIQPNVQNPQYAQQSQTAQKSQYSKYVRGFATSALATTTVLGTALAVNSIINSGAAQLSPLPLFSGKNFLKAFAFFKVIDGAAVRNYLAWKNSDMTMPAVFHQGTVFASDVCLVGICATYLTGY